MIEERLYENNMKFKLTKLKLHKDGNEYYLEAKYDTENTREKGILHIPKIPLRIANTPKINICESYGDYDNYHMRRVITDRTCEVNLGFGDIWLRRCSGKRSDWFTYQVTEEKVEELTLEEIEQKLGHKVKIVSEK